jgi:hypothetical protein
MSESTIGAAGTAEEGVSVAGVLTVCFGITGARFII